jgi:hypothetical protein
MCLITFNSMEHLRTRHPPAQMLICRYSGQRNANDGIAGGRSHTTTGLEQGRASPALATIACMFTTSLPCSL